MITDPRFAPARPELTFLRRRVRPKQQPAPPPAPAATSPTASTPAVSTPAATTPARSTTAGAPGSRIDYRRPERTPTAPPTAPPTSAPPAPVAPPAPAASTPAAPSRPAAPAAAPSVDYHHHGSGGSLDLSEPAPRATTPPPTAAPPPPAPPSGGSLDLSDPPPAAPRRTPAVPLVPPAATPAQQRHVVRVSGRAQQLMGIAAPTVTLSRVQSGIGQLTVEAFCSPEIGDLRLGAAYQLRSGGTGIVQHADGRRFGPSAKRPVVVGSREEYERIGLDLRQSADIERIAVYAYSESRSALTFGGTLVVTLFGGGRLELPLEKLYPGPIAMLMTFYNLDGELVVRAEMENIVGDVREAVRAYGFDRITWRDDRNPVD